ncbi:mating-type switching protein swi10 [Pyronema omphalodes]|nr:mating-type switching protein swi10 [Pyronema omphalodes]
MADDDYFGDIPDDVFTAAFDAAEKTRKTKATPKPPTANPTSIPSPPAPKTTAIPAPPVPKPASIPSPPAPKSIANASTTIPGPPGPPKVQQPIPQKVTAVPLPASAAQPVQKKPTVQQPVPQKLNKSAGSASSILVSPRQKGNPILTYVKTIPWEYGPPTLACDYLLGPSTCCLFLSLKYHKLHPSYIFTRIQTLGTSYNLRLLLVLVDIPDHSAVLPVLTRTCLLHNLTLFLSWTAQEAGGYLEGFKRYEHTPPTMIMERVAEDYATRVTEVITRVRGVNSTDATTLVSTFGSVRRAVNAAPEEVLMVGGWGQLKVNRWCRAVTEPFKTGGLGKSGRTPRAGIKEKDKGTTAAFSKGMDKGEQRKVQERLGVQVPREWVVEDDEEAIEAVMEMERQEERQRLAALAAVG